MKNLWLMVTMVTLFSANVFGAGNAVPAKVRIGLEHKFQNAQQVKWSKESAKEWEAEFAWHGKAYSANFNNQGEWLETEYRISESEIPVAVKTALKKDFPDYKITIAEISETNKGKVFEFDIKNGQHKKEIAYVVNGTLISK